MQLIRTSRGVEAVLWEDDSPLLFAVVRPDNAESPFRAPDASAPDPLVTDDHGMLTEGELRRWS